MVVGDAQISLAGAAIQYPPEAATAPIEAITGLPASRSRVISWPITSEAKALPPPLSIRSTTAFTLSSKRARRNRAAVESPPMVPALALPSTIMPRATTTATFEVNGLTKLLLAMAYLA